MELLHPNGDLMNGKSSIHCSTYPMNYAVLFARQKKSNIKQNREQTAWDFLLLIWLQQKKVSIL